MTYETKQSLLERGKALAIMFCQMNGISAPDVKQIPTEELLVGSCAYYRSGVTTICVPKCASIGFAGQQWSFPGYTVDRTPYGVIQHELGHHVDVVHSHSKAKYYGDFSLMMRARSEEAPITTYCPNDGEWFAEMFRVFVTNPDLLLAVRPRTHREMMGFFKPVFFDTWSERLAGAPERTMLAAQRKVAAAVKGKSVRPPTAPF